MTWLESIRQILGVKKATCLWLVIFVYLYHAPRELTTFIFSGYNL